MKKKTKTKKSDAVKTGTETASANSGALGNLLNKLRPSSTAPMSKLIPIKCIEDDKFKMQDDSYMDIVQIVTKDLNSASESDLEALIAAWARMYRTNGFDIKLVSLNTPTDTRGQQHYIQKKSRRIKCRYMTIFYAKWKHSLKMCRRRAPTVSIIFCYLQNLRMIISTHYLVSARP